MQIPEIVLNSDIYRDLSGEERANWLYGQERIADLCRKIDRLSADDWNEGNLEDISLDVFSCISLGDARAQISPWIVQTSWFNERGFGNSWDKSGQIQCARNVKKIHIEISKLNSREGIKFISAEMGNIQAEASSSSTFDAYVNHMISIDALLCSLLSLLLQMRLERVKLQFTPN